MRRFQWPAAIGSGTTIRLVTDAVGGSSVWRLNGTEIGAFPTQVPVSMEITSHVRRSNQLEVDVEFDPEDAADAPGGLYQPVRLEITESSP